MRLDINNKSYDISSSSDSTLLDVLREELRLTGTKRGCDIGVCGTCTVLINDQPKRSCIVKLSQLSETDKIMTIEGLTSHPLLISAKGGSASGGGERATSEGELHPIQEAFIEAGAIQCGFCTPGMVMTAKALLDKNPNPTREEIKKAFTLNLCRCTGYEQIFKAVELAARNTPDVIPAKAGI